jgi:pimeloyl-ACP methyl ester carboxylesterase
MARITFTNSRNLHLVGNLHRADSSAVVLMAHGYCGDKAAGGRFDRIAGALNEAGFNVLPFDFAGCGESESTTLTRAGMVDDLTSAIEFALRQRFDRIGLFGASLGATVCLECWSPDIGAMVLVGAATDAMYYQWSDYYSVEQLRQLGERGYMVVPTESRWRDYVFVDRQMLLDFEQVDQRQMLERVKCPVLLIHGNAASDWEENLLLEKSRRGIAFLSEESRLQVIEGADHRFFDHLDVVIELTCKWFGRYLK